MMNNYIPLGITITDNEGTIVRKNAHYDAMVAGQQAVQTGVKPWEICKGWFRSSGQLLRPQDWPAMQAIASGTPVLRVKIYVQRLDGSFGTILESAEPITDSWGRVSGARVITQDITGQFQPECITGGALLKKQRSSHRSNSILLTGYSLLPGNSGLK